MSKQTSLTRFFNPVATNPCNSSFNEDVPQNVEIEFPLTPDLDLPNILLQSNNENDFDPYDFGNAIIKGRMNMSDKEKKLFLKNPYKPPTNFDWPYVTRQNGERRFLRPRHLEVPEAEWISYSPRLKGLICRACYFFAKSSTGHNSAFNRQSAFVEKPFTRFGHIKSGTCGIPYHSLLDYHKNAVDAARVFLDPSLSNDIMKVMDQEFNEQHELLGQVIRTKVEAAIFLAKRSLSFRGHTDSGQLLIIENMQEFVGNEGNFRALLQYGALKNETDRAILIKANKSSQNATYNSPKIQNEIIGCIGSHILEKIVNKTKPSKFITVIADETTDAAGCHQLCIVVRYVDLERTTLSEKFIGFVELKAGNAVAISNDIIRYLSSNGFLTDTFVIGLGFDGANVMKGHLGGVQAQLRKHPAFKYALFVHCSAHCLNLSLLECCEITEIRYVTDIISEVSSFFSNHHYVDQFLDHAIGEHIPESRRTKIKSLCRTRWVENHDTCSFFLEAFDAIISAISQCVDSCSQVKARSIATGILNKMGSSEFIFSMVLLGRTMNVLKSLSQILQSEDLDLTLAVREVELVKKVLKNWLDGQDKSLIGSFDNISKEARNKISKIGGLRYDLRASKKELSFERFESKIYEPFLQSLIEQLDFRFGDHFEKAKQLSFLIPANIVNTRFDDVKPIFEFYEGLLQKPLDQLQSEYEMWKTNWLVKSQEERGVGFGILKVLKLCVRQSTPSIYTLLQIFATIPVSSASAERGFSALKRIKTYLRNAMTEERLNGLALAHINNEIEISPDKIVSMMAEMGPRKFLKNRKRIANEPLEEIIR